jgi:TPR repeat protein
LTEDQEVRITLSEDRASLVLTNARSAIIARGRKEASGLVGSQFGAPVPLSESRAKVLAEQGDPAAQEDLGDIYEQNWQFFRLPGNKDPKYVRAVVARHSTKELIVPPGPVTDLEEAAFWYRKAAAQGRTEAAYALGFIYQDGLGIKQNYAEAARWYDKAPDPYGAECLYDLGLLYEEGNGVSQNNVEAVRLFRLAAERGNAHAQACLGYMYSVGKGVPKSEAEAAHWFRKAAEAACDGANYQVYRLGHFLWARGENMEAYLWLNRAAKTAQGRESRDALASQMSPQELGEAERRAQFDLEGA